MFVPGTVTCVLLPRFSLTTASGERKELLTQPVALAPEPGGRQQVGEVSLAAEAFGIHSGMRLGEALARCPRLTLVPPDPAGVADAWERLLVRLEAVGVAVEPERPGLVCFDARGLLRLHGGTSLAERDRLLGVLRAVRAGLGQPARYRRGAVAICRGGRGHERARAPAGDRDRRPAGGGRVSRFDAGGAAAGSP